MLIKVVDYILSYKFQLRTISTSLIVLEVSGFGRKIVGTSVLNKIFFQVCIAIYKLILLALQLCLYF